MKGLLLKDWYQVRTSMKTMYLTVAFVLVIWVFSTSNAYVFPVSYAAIFLGILPVNLLTYDQSVGWVEYGRTLPVSKKTLVAEKVPHRSVLRCGGCCDRRTVRNSDPSAYRNGPGQGCAVPAGGHCVCHPADQRHFLCRCCTALGPKSPHDLRLTFAGLGALLGGRRCRDG